MTFVYLLINALELERQTGLRIVLMAIALAGCGKTQSSVIPVKRGISPSLVFL
jgi:hypothetical protein